MLSVGHLSPEPANYNQRSRSARVTRGANPLVFSCVVLIIRKRRAHRGLLICGAGRTGKVRRSGTRDDLHQWRDISVAAYDDAAPEEAEIGSARKTQTHRLFPVSEDVA